MRRKKDSVKLTVSGQCSGPSDSISHQIVSSIVKSLDYHLMYIDLNSKFYVLFTVIQRRCENINQKSDRVDLVIGKTN